ncbi:class I SAM-dependent methyltransferase [Marinimicrococcus flavescens]|uniref:Class I SAM-dependent methyltransferase n=1 Tax=Marinimicrococcus flavescens TaxID=3031815 RepID=A0AAP3V069_9PROT|nr:class I SAM-dependent methyltransferase [Marinimicrococcus flavescens]
MTKARLTEEPYWTERWARAKQLPRPVDPTDLGLGNATDLSWHHYFCSTFEGLPPGTRLLEVGAARSRWLPYFRKQFGFAVTGLDYSELGCAQARQVLEAAGVEGEIVHGDLFDPPPAMLGQFDVVVSFGVVEHFPDTAACLDACARFLAPGGIMITTIPNMRGSVGLMQRLVDQKVYRTHVPMDSAELAAAHGKAGLEVMGCGYRMFANWRLIALEEGGSTRLKRLVRKALGGLTTLAWRVQRRGVRLPANRLTSPYIACLARRSAGPD